MQGNSLISNSKEWLEVGLIQHLNKEQQTYRIMTKEEGFEPNKGGKLWEGKYLRETNGR